MRNEHKRSLIAIAVASALASSTMIVVDKAAAQAPQAGASADELEEVVVTGTRIRRDGMSTPTPVTAITSDELDLLGPGQLVEAVAAMPQFLANHLPTNGGAFNTDAGQSFLNLRGLGSSRMLVLLDGRRVVSAGQQGGVNINVFPEAAIERVEVVTGGASAAYGSDAIAGVTNFILNRDYVGFEADVQGGVTSRSDGENYELSVVGGFEVGSRGHVLLAGDHYSADGVFGWDERDWFQSYAELDNPNGPPARITVPNARTTLYTYGGLIPSGPLARTQFLADGTPAPFVAGTLVDPPFAQSGGDGVNPLVDNELYPEQSRSGAFALFNYELTDNVTAYFQGTYGRSIAEYHVSEMRLYGPFGTQATIFRDNAFLPAATGAAMDAAGIGSFTLHRMSSFADWTDIEDTQNTTRSFTAGLNAEAGEWELGTYFQYGRNERALDGYQARLDRVYQALDAVVDPATNQIVCASTLVDPNDGCEPLNLFGHGRMTPAARDYVLDTTRGTTLTRQRFAEFSASRDVLPGRDAGPLSIAAGVSYRDESLDAQVAPPEGTLSMPTLAEVNYRGLPAAQSGAPFIFQHANMLEAAGGYDVKEIFAETLIPLIPEGPSGRSLNLDLAGRYADYAGSGSIPAWKVGLDWRINQSVRFRATRSRDVRAANLGERFDRTITGPSYDDPFVGEEHTPLEQTVSGGNPEVDPERSDTTTFGVVFQPASIAGLSASVDWYDVRIDDAIDQIGGQLIIDLCFEEGSFCELLKQDPSTGRILRVDNIFVNLVEAGVKGIDFEVGYRRALGAGNLGLRFFGAYLSEHSFTDQFGNKIDSSGETGGASLPEWQGVLSVSYNRGPLTLAVTERYIGSGKRDNREIEGIDIDDNTVDAAWYTNLRFSYDITEAGTARVFLNVENLLDEDPPLAPGTFSFFGGAGHTNARLFDMLGRRYTLGVRFEF